MHANFDVLLIYFSSHDNAISLILGRRTDEHMIKFLDSGEQEELDDDEINEDIEDPEDDEIYMDEDEYKDEL